MGDAILTAIVIGIVMWVLLFVVYLVLGLIMTSVKRIAKDHKKYYNIALFRYDRPDLTEFDSFGAMMKSGLKMCSLITAVGFVIVLIICIIAVLT